jgi:hypothetical protein
MCVPGDLFEATHEPVCLPATDISVEPSAGVPVEDRDALSDAPITATKDSTLPRGHHPELSVACRVPDPDGLGSWPYLKRTSTPHAREGAQAHGQLRCRPLDRGG